MNVNDKIKELIALSNPRLTKTGIARELGIPSVQVLDRRLLSKSVPKIDFVAAILNTLNYRLVMVPKTSSLPAGSIEIDSDFEFKGHPAKANKKIEVDK